MRVLGVVSIAFLLGAPAASALPQDESTRRNLIKEEARKIDRYLRSKWRQKRIQPARPADDYEFLRRVYLDLTGTVPSPREIENFVRDPNPDKRYVLIDRLVGSEHFARHWAETLTNLFFGYTDGLRARREGLRRWLVDEIRKDTPYINIVRDLISASGDSRKDGPVHFVLRWLENNDRREITNRIAKLFVGVRISCAACHDHPFARWKRKDFYQLSTFFFRTKYRSVGEGKNRYWVVEDDYKNARTTSYLPKGFRKPVGPVYLTGRPPRSDELRKELAVLLTDDRQFVYAAVNRIWSFFFHRGMVDPPDDFSNRNRPSTPDLLNRLAARFVDYRFSLRTMARVITYTEAYQLSSVRPDLPRGKRRLAGELFAVRPLRVLNPSQIFDTIAESTRLAETRRFSGNRAGDLGKLRQAFLKELGPNWEDEFAPVGELNLSIQQIIRLITWKELYLGLDPGQGGLVTQVLREARSPEERVRRIFLALLSRPPTSKEMERSVAFAEDQGYDALGFAIMQTNEYFLNH